MRREDTCIAFVIDRYAMRRRSKRFDPTIDKKSQEARSGLHRLPIR
jgi:hypothetical protein